jgi:hypothetical protein
MKELLALFGLALEELEPSLVSFQAGQYTLVYCSLFVSLHGKLGVMCNVSDVKEQNGRAPLPLHPHPALTRSHNASDA